MEDLGRDEIEGRCCDHCCRRADGGDGAVRPDTSQQRTGQHQHGYLVTVLGGVLEGSMEDERQGAKDPEGDGEEVWAGPRGRRGGGLVLCGGLPRRRRHARIADGEVDLFHVSLASRCRRGEGKEGCGVLYAKFVKVFMNSAM